MSDIIVRSRFPSAPLPLLLLLLLRRPCAAAATTVLPLLLLLTHSLGLSHKGTCDPNEYVQLAKREECEEACRSDNEDKVDAEMKTVLVFGNDMAAENVAYLMLLFEAVSAIGLIVFTVWLTAKVTEEAQRYVPALTFW